MSVRPQEHVARLSSDFLFFLFLDGDASATATEVDDGGEQGTRLRGRCGGRGMKIRRNTPDKRTREKKQLNVVIT